MQSSQTYKLTAIEEDRHTMTQKDMQTDRQTGRQTDAPTDRQTVRHTLTGRYTLTQNRQTVRQILKQKVWQTGIDTNWQNGSN